MRFILLGGVALAGLVATPVLAADWTGFYAGVYGGMSVRNNSQADLTYVTGALDLDGGAVDPGVNNVNNIDPTAFDILEYAATGWGGYLGAGGANAFMADVDLAYNTPGLTLGGVFGYSAGNGWRFEGDWSYNNFGSADVAVGDVLHQFISGGAGNSGYDWTKDSETTTSGGNVSPYDFYSSAEFFLSDVWYDFDNDTSFTPYVGGGAGLAFVNTIVGDTETVDIGFAGMIGTGVRVDLNDTSFLDFGYRYKVASTNGGSASGYSDNQDGTTYTFAGYQLDQQGMLGVQTLQLGYNMIFQ